MLELTFYKGRPFAAYLHVASTRRRASKTRELAPSLIGDFSKAGELLGLEILSFDKPTISRINRVLVACGQAALPARGLAPLRAA